MTEHRFEPGTQPDSTFLRNAKNARENGFDLLCAECGEGIMDDAEFGSEDNHDPWCPNIGRDPHAEQLEWIANVLAKKRGRTTDDE